MVERNKEKNWENKSMEEETTTKNVDNHQKN